MRIKLFNKKTLYEIYDLNFEMHIDFNKDLCRATLISKEVTLGPRIIYCYVRILRCDPAFFDDEKYIEERMETEFIHHLNENVGVECFIKKEEIPEEIYKRIKNESKNKISLVEI